jgi:predicted Zn finger-like uncharacterized protein
MQVAIHTCEACGTRLQILEQFLGRTVRCTNCGREFVARLPARSAAPPADPDAVIASCPGCGTRLRVSAEKLDRKLRCPSCDQVFVVPRRRPAEAPDQRAEVAPAPTPEPRPELAQELPPEPPPPAPPAEMGSSAPQSPLGSVAEVPQVTSYRHECTACGATMQVHARYFGRTLRCTSCRTEFEAHPPPGGEVPETVSGRLSIELDRAPVLPEERARRRRWLAAALVLAAIVGVALWWLGGDRRHGFASELFTVTKARTEIGVLQRGDRPTVTAALDREALEEMIAALGAGDEAGVERLRSSPRCIEIAAGTRVRVLERRKRAVEARVRVLEGPWESRIVWVPIDWVK